VKPEEGSVNSSLSRLATALSAAQAEIVPPTKRHTATVPTKTGGSYSYKYSTLDELIDAIRPAFRYGLSFIQPIVQGDHSIGVSTVILHASGESYDTGAVLLPCGDTPQSMGSALTYARRYSLGAAFGIAAEDDDDGATAERSTRTPKAPKTTAAPPAREAGDEPLNEPLNEPFDEIPSAAMPHPLTPVTGSPTISEAQAKRLFAIAKSKGWTTEGLKAHLALFGYDHSRDIVRAHYDDIIASLDEGVR
jgi:hypothetical protein